MGHDLKKDDTKSILPRLRARMARFARTQAEKNTYKLQQTYAKYSAELVKAAPETKPQLMKQLKRECDKINLNPKWMNE